jgi:hypothetical protein
MASRYTHDIVATTGTYKDGQGAAKKRYTTVGKLFTDDQGRQSIKLDTIPVGPDWSGWLSIYPRDNNRDSQPRQQPTTQDHTADAYDRISADTAADDIPF